MANTSILIVDDHVLFRESLTHALGLSEEFTVYSCSACSDALQALTLAPVDIVLLNFDRGSEWALNLLRAFSGSGSNHCRVVVLTAGVSPATARELLSFQCVSGLLGKAVPLHELRNCLISLMADGRWIIDERYASALSFNASDGAFSDRERQVMRFLVEGCSNKEIAARLFRSESTVKNVLQGLFRRFNVRTRSQLVRVALEEKAFFGADVLAVTASARR